MANTSLTNGTSALIKFSDFPPTLPNVPLQYQEYPQKPGKIELLLNSNSNYLYHKFSPYTNYKSSGIFSSILSNRQPFVYSYIDDNSNAWFNELPPIIQTLGTISNITPDTVNDVIRVSKFLISSWGVQFLVTQAAIQRLAPFDETRVYNPLSPILATIQPMTLGIGNRPMRHIEGGIFGLLNSITSTVGINMESGFQTPSSTVGNSALPPSNIGEGKGLIRGGDASKGYAQLQLAWPVSSPKPNSGFSNGISSMVSTMTNAAKQMFGTTNITQPAGTQVRADEKTYGLMATSYKLRIHQSWFPSLNTNITDGPSTLTSSPLIQLQNNISNITSTISNPIGSAVGVLSSLLNPSSGGSQQLKRYKLITLPKGKTQQLSMDSGLVGLPIIGKISNGLGGNNTAPSATGYQVKDGDKYGSDVGIPQEVNDLTNSDMLVQYSYYVNDSQNYDSKFSSPNSLNSAERLNDVLQTVVKDFSLSNTYKLQNTPISYLLPSVGSGNTYVKYDNWTNKQIAQGNQKIGVSAEYADGNSIGSTTSINPIPTIDAFVSSQNNLRMATSFFSDGINTLGIVPKNRQIKGSNINKNYPKWIKYEPYKDDLIAFFFYDVVNEKYIPFRATVKTISEGNTAFWDELRFIGRSDQLYSYNGFNRTLSFSFNVVIGSVTELLPTWKKINYMASSVKPSNYTVNPIGNKLYNRFMVPPMFMLTIGDLYKFQPMIITSINVNIPDDASWETLNENNSRKGWSYLNGIITSPNVGKNYGQLPREVEISVTCNLLEKERAIVGGSHFGHEPRIDDWEDYHSTDRFLTSVSTTGGNEDTTVGIGPDDAPYLPPITKLHQHFIEWNETSQANRATAPGTTSGSPLGPTNGVNNSIPASQLSTIPLTQSQLSALRTPATGRIYLTPTNVPTSTPTATANDLGHQPTSIETEGP